MRKLINSLYNYINANNVNNIIDDHNKYPLHLAVQCGSTVLIEKCLCCNANPNVQDVSGNTPLHFLCNNIWFFHDIDKQTHIDCFKLLINAGANMNIVNKYNATPLTYLVIDDYYYLLEYVTQPIHDVNLLHFSRNIYVIEWLLLRGADINAQDGAGSTPLHYAIYYNMQEIEKYYMKHPKTNLSLKNKDGYTAIELTLFKHMKHII